MKVQRNLSLILKPIVERIQNDQQLFSIRNIFLVSIFILDVCYQAKESRRDRTIFQIDYGVQNNVNSTKCRQNFFYLPLLSSYFLDFFKRLFQNKNWNKNDKILSKSAIYETSLHKGLTDC